MNKLKIKIKDYVFSTFKNQILDFVKDKINMNHTHTIVNKNLDVVKMNYQYEFDENNFGYYQHSDFIYERMLNDAKMKLMQDCINYIKVEEDKTQYPKRIVKLNLYVGNV